MDGTLRVDIEPRDNAHWADGHWLGALPGRITRIGCIEPDHSTSRRIQESMVDTVGIQREAGNLIPRIDALREGALPVSRAGIGSIEEPHCPGRGAKVCAGFNSGPE